MKLERIQSERSLHKDDFRWSFLKLFGNELLITLKISYLPIFGSNLIPKLLNALIPIDLGHSGDRIDRGGLKNY